MRNNCKYCDLGFVYEKGNHHQYSAHLSNCSLNPKTTLREERLKIQKINTKKKNLIILKSVCIKCKGDFLQTFDKTQKWQKRLCCSLHCANSHVQTSKQNKQRSLKLKGNLNPNKKPLKSNYCIICNKEFFTIPSRIKLSCGDNECYSKLQSYKLKGKTGGPRKGGGRGKHKDYFKTDKSIVHCQSTMEYKMCEILDLLGLTWSRNLKGFPYQTLTGKERKYYPDFYIKELNCFLETKGYTTEEVEHKMNISNVPNLKIIKYRKFGGNFEDICNNPNKLLEYMHV